MKTTRDFLKIATPLFYFILKWVNCLCLVAACIWWGRLTFLVLQMHSWKKKWTYASVKDFEGRFNSLNDIDKIRFGKLLIIDNEFVLIFGSFLISYALLLFLKLHKKYVKPFSAHFIWVFVAISMVYMISDWHENELYLNVINGKTTISDSSFLLTQYVKFIAALSTLLCLILIDAFILKRYPKLFLCFLLSVILIAATVYGIAGYVQLKSLICFKESYAETTFSSH